MSFWKDLWKLWRHDPMKECGTGITNTECIPDIKPKEKTIWCVRCDEDIWYPIRPGECHFHFEFYHFDRSCYQCSNKKKNPEEPIGFGMMTEINCLNCGIICFIGTISDGEEKEFHCEAGEASCGYSWKQKFKFENVHDYDIENYRDGKWCKTNWGGKDKNIVLKRAEEIMLSFANNKTQRGKETNGVRVVDRQGNVYFEWIRNEN